MSPVSAVDVAAVLREQLPGLASKKLHKLLYYCQGHHLGTFDSPLFRETISAWDMGPVVGRLWRQQKLGVAPIRTATLDEAQLNTIGYVVSRYGHLSGTELEERTHDERPWQLADADREPAGNARIEPGWMAEFFAPPAISPEVERWLADAADRLDRPAEPDTVEAIEQQLRDAT